MVSVGPVPFDSARGIDALTVVSLASDALTLFVCGIVVVALIGCVAIAGAWSIDRVTR